MHRHCRRCARSASAFASTTSATGIASLGYLAAAPVQRLKIAASLVAGALGHRGVRRARYAPSCCSARELGSEIVADGVETQAQAMFLLAAGCEQAQGPFFGRYADRHGSDGAVAQRSRWQPKAEKARAEFIGRLTHGDLLPAAVRLHT